MRPPSRHWEPTSLGAHTDVQTGFPFKSQQYTDDPSAIPLLRGDNIVQGKLRWEGVKRWPAQERHLYGKYELEPDDVVVAMDRPWIEAGLKYAWITERDLPCLLVQRVARLRGRNGLLTKYIRYIVGHHSFTDYLKGIWTGIAVPHISESQIRAFKFPLPPRHEQERILEVLSAYDDLIENNTRRIKILEEMAQMIYRDWFVHFRFPGHEKVRMVESELGPIPEGWSAGPMEAVCERVTDGSHWSPKTVERGRPMASSKDLHKWGLNLSTCRWISQEDFDELVRNDCRPLAGDILITKDGANYLKYCFCVEKDMDVVLLSSVAMIRPDPTLASSLYVAFHLSDESVKTRLAGRVSGAAIPRIVLKDFRQFTILLPPLGLQRRFDQAVQPLVALCWRLIDKNANLRTTRDLLLPKLISGEITVEVAEDVAAELTEEVALHA